MKTGKYYLETRFPVPPIRAKPPTSDHTQPQSMTALRAPSPSQMAVHRLVANSHSLGARCVLQACSDDWAAASSVDDKNDVEGGPTKNGEIQVQCGDIINAREGEGEGGSPPTDKASED